MGALSFMFLATTFSVLVLNVHALSEESEAKIMADFMPALEACTSELGVEFKAVKSQVKAGTLDADNPDRCIFACIFKKLGFMDEEGMFSKEKTLAETEKNIKDPDDAETIKKTVETCASVNEEPVSDGKEGCDRGVLLVKCIMKPVHLME